MIGLHYGFNKCLANRISRAVQHPEDSSECQRARSRLKQFKRLRKKKKLSVRFYLQCFQAQRWCRLWKASDTWHPAQWNKQVTGKARARFKAVRSGERNSVCKVATSSTIKAHSQSYSADMSENVIHRLNKNIWTANRFVGQRLLPDWTCDFKVLLTVGIACVKHEAWGPAPAHWRVQSGSLASFASLKTAKKSNSFSFSKMFSSS